LSEIEEKCGKIESARKQIEQQLSNLEKLELEATRRNKEAQILREIARIRGEEPQAEPGLDELEKTRETKETLEIEVKNMEIEVLEGMKDITLPIPKEIPKVEPSGNATMIFEGGPYHNSVKFIASTMNVDVPMELDKTQLHPDKVIVTNVKDSAGVIERLIVLRNNLGRLARIALQEEDADVKDVVDYLYKSDCRDLWEATKGRKKISYDMVFSELGITDAKGKKRVRNFFTNLEQQLKDKFPFLRIDAGSYELSFFGSLVWKRYNDVYPLKNIPKVTIPETAITSEPKKEEVKKSATPSLNKYLSNEERELIYGKEGS